MYSCLGSTCDSEGRVALEDCSGHGITVYQVQFVTQQFLTFLKPSFPYVKQTSKGLLQMEGAWNRKRGSDLTADAFPEVQMGSRLEMYIPQIGSVTMLVLPQKVCGSAGIGQADRDLRQSLVKENFKAGQYLMYTLVVQ